MAYMQLARPANVVTAWADVLAGMAIASLISVAPGVWDGFRPEYLFLLVATTGLYAGGVVFNDIFDAELDAVERPERPIPSGRASIAGAITFGSVLLVGGIAAAGMASWQSGLIALFIAGAALLYDAKAKHHALWGPFTMGLCRSANLLLGISLVPSVLYEHYAIGLFGLIPLLYIGAITAISQGEVHGGTRRKGWFAVGLLMLVATLVLYLLWFFVSYKSRVFSEVLAEAGVFYVGWLVMVAIPFFQAAQNPEAMTIRNAVRAGVLGLIPLNAVLAAGVVGWELGLAIIALLPLSLLLGRLFAIT